MRILNFLFSNRLSDLRLSPGIVNAISARACSRLLALIVCIFSANSPCLASEAEWTKDCQLGKSAYEQCNWGQAERYFKAAIKEAEAFGPSDVRLANSLTNLGVLYNCRGQTAKAAPVFERAIAIKQAALGPENSDVVDSVGRLCQFYIAHNDYSKAEPIASKLALFAQKSVKDRRAIDSSFSKLREFYANHAEFKDAETLFKKTEEETRKTGSNLDLEFAVLLDGLGESFKSSNKLPLADKLCSSALAIREVSLPPTHAAIAASLRHLAGLYILEGKSSLAEPLIKRSVQIYTKTFGPQKSDTLAAQEELASCFLQEGKLKEAEEQYRQQVTSAQEAFGKQSKQSLNANLALASFLMKAGRPSEAAAYFDRALNISEKTNGPDHASLPPILESYAEALEKSNRKAEAKKYLARAKAIRG